MSDYAVARHNMVESQVRPNQVTDQRLLRAMMDIPRENFVPASLRPLAYMEQEIPVAPPSQGKPQRALVSPMPLARMIQLAEIEPGNLVLDVGCATGYSTAILARLAESVVGLECDEGLAEQASQILVELEVDNAAVVSGPLPDGYASEGPYDAILLNGAVPAVPGGLMGQLKEGGRLVTIIAAQNFGRAMLFRNRGGHVNHRPAFDAAGPALPGFELEEEFVF